MMKAIRRLPFISVLLCCLSSAQVQSAPHTVALAYQFGVFPYLSPSRIEQFYAPLAEAFAAVLQREVRLRTRQTFAAWYDEVKQQHYDIVFIQPFDYIHAFDQYDYLPLARNRDPLAAVIMVKTDSPLQSLADLRGRIVALPSARAAVSHLTKTALLEAGLTPGQSVTIQHVDNHNSCLQQMLIGDAAACGTSLAVARNFMKRYDISLRELAVTPAIPHVLFAAHKRVPAQERERLREVILKLHETDRGRRFLAGIGCKAFEQAQDADYDTVRAYARRLGLTK